MDNNSMVLEEEIWKPVEEDGRYSVSSFGNVVGPHGRNLKISSAGRIKFPKANKTLQVGRLVARAFIPNPENKPHIFRIDGNKLNNRVDNLLWSSYNEFQKRTGNAKGSEIKILQYGLSGEFIKKWDSQKDAVKSGVATSSPGINACLKGQTKRHAGFVWRYDDENLDGEFWKELDFSGRNLQVSSHGRICADGNRKTFGLPKQNGYLYVKISKKTCLVHRLVAMAFCGGMTEEKKWIDHVDGNKSNNHFSNLEWVTPSENAQRAFDTGLTKKRCKIVS
ncbi:HNH endonuclease [Brazilian marseillevirus]|uniref:HNH endonuclease n=1 Tax=Brazilian marseillevirus TaxID=1813599 RepID=UPI000785AA92|nr:HNH endonuclease [Brazilian marseillevirus]AMQ10610.1 HNH endonuclease [Brazilian marseillevirus]